MDSHVRRRIRNAFLLVCGLTAVWTIVNLLTGGFRLTVAGHVLFSSRGHRNPMVIAIVTGIVTWVLSTRAERRRFLQAPPRWLLSLRLPGWCAPALVAIVALMVVVTGIRDGSFVAGGADCYGYVSQAHLWATGTVRVEQPVMHEVHWTDAPVTLAPLGYRVTDDGNALVPMFPPGLPLTMAVFEIAGGMRAVYYVVPLLGGLAVWATYLMGVRLGGRAVGTTAAILLATSPTFLIQLMFPMTDVPVAAWWALSLALLARGRRWSSLGAGLAAGAGFLTRLNLAPLSLVGLGYLVWQATRGDRDGARDARIRTVLYLAGLVPACLAIAAINQRLYGSPFITGLGPAGAVYNTRYIWGNLATYPRWLLSTQTPVVALSLMAPLLLWWRGGSRESRALAITWVAFLLAGFGAYLLYETHDVWFWLRYLLPTFPALFALTAAAMVALLSWLPAKTRTLALAVIVCALAARAIDFARHENLFGFREGERKTSAVGDFVRTHMSERAVFITTLHSGSVRHYSGRLTVRYDVMPPEALDPAIAELRRLGYHPYLLLEPMEVEIFTKRFTGYSALAPLDWTPYAVFDHSTLVRIWDPADQNRPTGSQPIPQSVRVE